MFRRLSTLTLVGGHSLLRNKAKKFFGFNVGRITGAEHCQMVLLPSRGLKCDRMMGDVKTKTSKDLIESWDVREQPSPEVCSQAF